MGYFIGKIGKYFNSNFELIFLNSKIKNQLTSQFYIFPNIFIHFY